MLSHQLFYHLYCHIRSIICLQNNRSRLRMHIPAPKTTLPGHAESYNPPPEYLFSHDELKKWRTADKEDRRQNFVPQKFTSMRAIPGYKKFITERFERCLDLYLCPRQQKMRVSAGIPWQSQTYSSTEGVKAV